MPRKTNQIKRTDPSAISKWDEREAIGYLARIKHQKGNLAGFVDVAKYAEHWNQALIKRLLGSKGFPRTILAQGQRAPIRIISALANNSFVPAELWDQVAQWCFLAGVRLWQEDSWKKALISGQRPLSDNLIAKLIGSDSSPNASHWVGRHLLWEERFYEHPKIVEWAQTSPQKIPQPLRLMLKEGAEWPLVYEALVKPGNKYRHTVEGQEVLEKMPAKFWQQLPVERWLGFISMAEGGPRENMMGNALQRVLDNNIWKHLALSLPFLSQADRARILAETPHKEARLKIIEILSTQHEATIVEAAKATRKAKREARGLR